MEKVRKHGKNKFNFARIKNYQLKVSTEVWARMRLALEEIESPHQKLWKCQTIRVATLSTDGDVSCRCHWIDSCCPFRAGESRQRQGCASLMLHKSGRSKVPQTIKLERRSWCKGSCYQEVRSMTRDDSFEVMRFDFNFILAQFYTRNWVKNGSKPNRITPTE